MFSVETIRFLNDLRQNNDRSWFQSQKPRYDAHVKAGSRAFCAAMEVLLAGRYDVDTSARMFRINRDLRFSKDKTPYNTHVHLSFADPDAQAAWMIGLEVDRLVLGYGTFAFDKERLDRWRERVAGPARETLSSLLHDLPVRLDPPGLKRVPAPYPADHPSADLLRRKGFAVWLHDLPVDMAFGENAPERLMEQLAAFDPVRDWFIVELSR